MPYHHQLGELCGVAGVSTLTYPLVSAGRLSLPAETRERRENIWAGKPEAFRKSGGGAAFFPTLTRPWRGASLGFPKQNHPSILSPMGTGVFPFFTVLLIAIVAWLVVGFGVGLITGWASLAQRYCCEERFSGKRLRFRSAGTRYLSHYSNCLTLGVNPQGLFLLRWHGHPARANSWPRWPCHFKLNQCLTRRYTRRERGDVIISARTLCEPR